MKDNKRDTEVLFKALGEIDEDLLSEALFIDNEQKLNELKKKENKKIVFYHPTFIKIAAVCVCVALVVTSIVTAPLLDFNFLIPDITSSQDKYENDIKNINSLDKLNFYSGKKAISQNMVENLSAKNKNHNVITLTENGHGKLLSLSNSISYEVDQNTPFTVNMVTYFAANLDDKNGFLAKKLGGTGRIEVVITKNSIENMITFRKGNKYYSCLQSWEGENAIAFSTNRYIKEFSVVENTDEENYEFTVYLEGDKINGIECNRLKTDKNDYKQIPDDISLADNFCFIINKTQTFKVSELEEFFVTDKSSENSNSGISLGDGTVVFGEINRINKNIAIKDQNLNTILTSENILKIYAKYNEKNKYFIELQLNATGKNKIADIYSENSNEKYSIYNENGLISELTLQVTKGSFCITNIESQIEISKLFNKLSQNDVETTSNKIGEILDLESFKAQMSKRINLNDYTPEVKEYFTSGQLTYNLKRDKKLEKKVSTYQIVIDDTKITTPIKVSDFMAMGWKIYNNDLFEDGKTGSLTFENGKGNRVSTYIYDFDGTASDYTQSYIAQINFYPKEESEKCPDFVMLEGININTTLDDVVTMLGEPSKIYLFTSYTESTGYKMANIHMYYNFITPDLREGYYLFNFSNNSNSNANEEKIEMACFYLYME